MEDDGRPREELLRELAELRRQLFATDAERDERRRAEAALAESERRLRQIVDLIPHFVFVKDRDGRFLLANAATAAIHGRSVAEVEGRTIRELAPPNEPIDRWLAEDAAVLATRQPLFLPEERFVDATGRERIVETAKIPFRFSERHPEALLCVSIDIAGRTHAREALERLSAELERRVAERTAELSLALASLGTSEARHRALLDALPDATFVVAADDTVLDVRAPAGFELSRAPEEMVGRPVRDTASPGLAPFLVQALERARSTGRPQVVEYEIDLPGGRRYREGRLVPYGDLCLALLRDVTDRREADQLKSAFVATVSHELRTPLTAILGAVKLLSARVPKESPDGTLLDVAARNTERLGVLVDDLLDVERLARAEFVLRPEPLRLADLLSEAIRVNQPYADQFGVRLLLDAGVPPARLLADRARLLQVLTNLLANAAKFSPEGGSVEVGAARVPGGVRVTVSDRGPGLSVEFQPRAFQRFAQEDTSDGRRRSGAGLGLFIAKRIVERHGGAIGFETRPGDGTTFYVDLPAVDDGAPI